MAQKKTTRTDAKAKGHEAGQQAKATKPDARAPEAGDDDGPHAEIRRILVKRREDLVEESRQEMARYLKGEDREAIDEALDDGDWSVLEHTEAIKIRKFAVHREMLLKIDESLRKIDEGTYGHCDDCGDEISPERLKVLPFAIRCRDCQEDEEERESAERGESIVFDM
jgi:DnaK suppressor protein